MKQVDEWRKEKDKQLSWVYEINDHGKAYLSPKVREAILDMFTNDSDLALIDNEAKCMLRDSSHPDRCVFLDSHLCNGEDYCIIYREFKENGWRVVIPLADTLAKEVLNDHTG